ncbi:trypsin-like peptidase domain-containing protein [bacterium]|nr:trypsin-like peptidase domain-containing protein [bacterium]
MGARLISREHPPSRLAARGRFGAAFLVFAFAAALSGAAWANDSRTVAPILASAASFDAPAPLAERDLAGVLAIEPALVIAPDVQSTGPAMKSDGRLLAGRHVDAPALADGAWTVMPGSRRALAVSAPGARFTRLHIDATDFAGRLVLVGRAGVPIDLTDRAHRSSPFWSPVVAGDIAVLILQDGGAPPRVTRVAYGFADPFGGPKEQGCHIDVACHAEIAPYAAGVGLLFFEDGGFSYLCTGSLLADVPASMTPWLLTAHHCIGDQATAESLEVVWHDEAASCGGAAPLIDALPSTLGADYVDGSFLSDFALLRLFDDPPDTASYLGFSLDPPAADEPITVIHHPAGTKKRVTFGAFAGNLFTHWRAIYTDGSTEGGSSGSALFNDDMLIIGQLSGGGAACSRMNATDSFGKLSLSWALGLSAWLDGEPPASTTTTTEPTTTTTIPDSGDDDATDDDDATNDDTGDDAADAASGDDDDDDGDGCGC